MNRVHKVINNTLILLIGQIVTWASTLLLTIGYGRFLGDFKFGELYFALTFALLIGTPLQFGYDNQIIRSVSQEPDRAHRYFWSVFLIKLGIWPIVYGAALLATWLLGYSGEVLSLVAICGLTLLSSSLASLCAAVHYAFERTVFPTIGNILEKGLSALFGLFLLNVGAGVQVMAFVLLAGSLINCIWQVLWFLRQRGIAFVVDWKLIRTLVRANIPFLIYGILMMSYLRIDTVLLSLMANSAVVGWYGAATRLFDTLSFLPNIVNNVLYPISSKLSLSSDASLRRAVEKSVNFLLFCGMPITVGIAVTAPNIVAFLYHRPEFSHTIPALQFLAPGVIFLYINMAFSVLLLTKKLDKKIPIMAAIALVFNVGCNLILIPLYQHIGAAIVTALTEVLLFGLGLIFIPRYLLPVNSLPVALKALLASGVMALALLPLQSLNILLLLPIAALVYFAAAFLLGTLPREDYWAVYNAIRRKATVSSSPVPLPEQSEQGQESEGGHMTLEQGVPVHFLKTNPRGWLRASLPKLKETLQEAMAHASLAQKELEDLPWSQRHEYLHAAALMRQERRWEDAVGIKGEASHFTLLVPIHNEASCLPSFLRTLLFSDIPASVNLDIIFITNACTDTSSSLVDAFLYRLGAVEERKLPNGLQDSGLKSVYKMVKQGSTVFKHVDTQTRGKANALHIGNSIAYESGHLITMSVDANNYLEPDAIRIMFKHALWCFRSPLHTYDTVLLSGRIQAERKASAFKHLLNKVQHTGQQLVNGKGLVNGCLMAWNTEWMHLIGGPPPVALEDYALGIVALVHDYHVARVHEANIWVYDATNVQGLLHTRARYVRGNLQILDFVQHDPVVVHMLEQEAYYMRNFPGRLHYLFEKSRGRPWSIPRYLVTFFLWERARYKGIREYRQNPTNQSWEKVDLTY